MYIYIYMYMYIYTHIQSIVFMNRDYLRERFL